MEKIWFGQGGSKRCAERIDLQRGRVVNNLVSGLNVEGDILPRERTFQSEILAGAKSGI